MNNLGDIIEELHDKFKADSGREKLDDGEIIVAVCSDGVVELTMEDETLKVSASICKTFKIEKNIMGE